MNSTLRKKGTVSKTKQKRATKIDMKKLEIFNHLWSVNTPRLEVQKQLNIGKTSYYHYLDAAEDIADGFVLGMVDHGLVLQFRESMGRMHEKVLLLNKISKKVLEHMDKMDIGGDLKQVGTMNNIVRTYVVAEKTYNLMLDDSKLVNQTMKTLNKVIVKNAQQSGESGKGR